MSYYKVGTRINLKRKQERTTKITDLIFTLMVGTLATYGFMDIILRANGL